MAVARAPGDERAAAGQFDLGGAGELAEPDAGDQRRAGGGAAGERRAGAALPDAQPRMAGVGDPAKLTLARSGKSGWFSTSGPTLSSWIEAASSTKKTACGLPMLTAAGPHR